MKNIKLGIAPIAWTNDDMPDLGSENTFKQCVSEMALAGFEGCEIGNKYPKDPVELKYQLDIRGLQVCNAWFSTFLTTENYAKTEVDFRIHCQKLHALGAKIVGVSEQGNSIQGTDLAVFDKKYVLNDAEWKLLCDGLNKLGKLAREEYDIGLTFHHHMGTSVQTLEETDRLMAGTDAAYVNLLFDSGHFAYSGENPVAILEKYIDRVRHVHLKDIRPKKIAWVKDTHKSFLEGVRAGTFTVPGDGAIDFAPIFDILRKNDYSGWVVVEAEQDPAIADPYIYAVKAKAYIGSL